MDTDSSNTNASRRPSAGSENVTDASKSELNRTTKKPSNKAGDDQQSNSNLEDNDDDDKEGDDDDDDDKEKVIEKSPNERFLKKNAQILSYKVPGVNAYVSFEIKTGKEVIWNDVICESAELKEARLLTQIKKMRRSYHPNCMRILDCWRHENRICFITERPDETYTTLRHWFNISRLSRNSATSKRLIRQVVSGLKYFQDHSLVHGNISTDSILIYGTNVKLGPFALDSYWHSHTVRKTTKKNFYLSSDWSDPAARITSLTDAYAMGVLCLEIVLWNPLDNELSEAEDVPKYVLEKMEQFDDPLLRNFTKVCMSGNRQLGIVELFDLSAFFEPPSLRHAAAKVITDAVMAHFTSQSSQNASTTQVNTSSVTPKQSAIPPKLFADINGAYQQLLRHARSSFEDDSIVAQVNHVDGSTRQLLFKDVAQYYISFKFLEDIDHGYYPMIKFDSNGKAIVPRHVKRIINGDWQKGLDEKDGKEGKEKGPNLAPNQPLAGVTTASETCVPMSSETAKGRKETKDPSKGEAALARAAASDKVSPPRAGAVSAVTSSASTGNITPSGLSRQPVASPARQPSKLPVIDSQGVRRSTSVSGLAAGAAKGAETASVSGGGGSGTAGGAAVGTSAGGSGGSCVASSPAVSTTTRTTGVGTGGKEPKRATLVRSSKDSCGSSSLQGATAGGPGGSGGGHSTSGSSTGALTSHGHSVVRRSSGKLARGAIRSSTGSSVGIRRRGGSTSPMPQRARLHGADTSGRLMRGAHTGGHGRQTSVKSAAAESTAHVTHEDQGRSHGPRLRRVSSEGTTREHHRRASLNINENRPANETAEKVPEAVTGATSSEITSSTFAESSEGKDAAAAGPQLSTRDVQLEAMHSSEEDEYEDDYDYYDDIEELYEEDEIEYESQFEARGRRGQEEHVLNIITDVTCPEEAERGSAYFTDVFYEYLGLGRWLLVVKFHLLRCREDPRGNPYREVQMQLKDNEWHDIDVLVERLTCGPGLLMRPEERPILRQYLDAARHNRPLRETYVQNGLTGPDPEELRERLLTVQKELQMKEEEDQPVREEKAGSQEPGLPSDLSGQSSRHTEGLSRLRSSLETPASESVNQPHTAACPKNSQPVRIQEPDDCVPRRKGTQVGEGEAEAEEEGSGKRTFACSCVPGTHGQNPLEPLNKYCPFCDRCDYLLVEGPAYLRSPCYHCRVFSAEKEGLSPEQLYRLHTQNHVPWPLFLQKYFRWPPDEPVTDAMALNDCKWRSRVVCVCFQDQEIWPPCVEFPWLYNPPQGSIAYRMQVEQFSPSSHLELMNLWCRRQSQRTDILKNVSSITSMYPSAAINGSGTNPTKRSRSDRDPELAARYQRRTRSLTVGSAEHAHWSQLFSMSIAMQHHTISTHDGKASGTPSVSDNSGDDRVVKAEESQKKQDQQQLLPKEPKETTDGNPTEDKLPPEKLSHPAPDKVAN